MQAEQTVPEQRDRVLQVQAQSRPLLPPIPRQLSGARVRAFNLLTLLCSHHTTTS